MSDYLRPEINFEDPALVSVFDEVSLWTARFGAFLLDHLPLAGEQTILDLGCGTGFPLLELARLTGPRCHLVGLDPWAAALARAEEKRRMYGEQHVSLVHGDGARLPFASGVFDLIVSNLGINNFRDAPAAFKECARVTKRGGRLALTTNYRGHMHEFYTIFRETLEAAGLEEALPRLEGNEAHRGTPESVGTMVEAGGFRVVRVEERSFAMRFLDGSALLRHWLTRIGFLQGWRAVVGPAHEATFFPVLEARLNAHAETMGELRVTIPMLYLEAERV